MISYASPINITPDPMKSRPVPVYGSPEPSEGSSVPDASTLGFYQESRHSLYPQVCLTVSAYGTD